MGELKKEILLDTIRQFGGQPKTVTVHRAFVEFTGSLEAGMMLSQLLYWSERDGGRGRVAKSDAGWIDELCLTQYAVRQARKTLENMTILRTEVHRFNGVPTVHYFLLEDALSEQWELWIRKNVLAKSKEQSCEIAKSLTETTTETTTESKTGDSKTESPPPAEKQPCGHALTSIVGSDEGTQYCRECVDEIRVGDSVEFVHIYAMVEVGKRGTVERSWKTPGGDRWARVVFGKTLNGTKLAQSVPFNVLKRVPSAAADFAAMPSASDGLVPQAHTAATADPRIAKKQFIQEIAPICAEIMGRAQVIGEDTRTARKIFEKRLPLVRVMERLDAYRNGDGAEFRKPGAIADWIVGRIERDLARRVCAGDNDAAVRAKMLAA